MRKHLNNPWVVTALALGAVLVVVGSLRDQMSGDSRVRSVVEDEAEASVEEGAAPQLQANGLLSITGALAGLSFAPDLPDPFRRRGPTVVAGEVEVVAGPKLPDDVESVRLSAVWNQGETVFAVLNGRIMRQGETIGRMTVDTITTDGVWVSHWKGRNLISFGGEFTLVTPAATASPLSPTPHEN